MKNRGRNNSVITNGQKIENRNLIQTNATTAWTSKMSGRHYLTSPNGPMHKH